MFEKILDNLSDPIIITDKDFLIRSINLSAAKMLGFSSEELAGQSGYKIFNDGSFNEMIHADLIKKGFFFLKEISCKTKEGHHIPVSLHGSALHNDTDECRDLILLVKKLEVNAIHPLFNYSSFSIAIIDVRGKIKFVNRKFTELSGYQLDEVLDNPHYLIESGNLSEEEKKHLFTSIQQGRDWKGEIECINENGDLCYYLLIVIPVKIEEGLPQRYMVINEDISEVKKKEWLLMQQLEDLSLVNSLNEISAFGGDSESLTKAMIIGMRKILNNIKMVLCIASKDGKYLEMQYFAGDKREEQKIESLINGSIPKIRIKLENAPIHRKMLQANDFTIIEGDEISEWFFEYLNSTKLPIKRTKKGSRWLFRAVRELVKFNYVIAVPMVFNKTPIGAVHMTSTNPFTDTTIARLKNISLLVTNIIKRTQMEDSLKEKTLQLQSLTRHLDLVREEERKYIARELHDDLGQMITALRMDISTIRNKMNGDISQSEKPNLQHDLTNSIKIMDDMLNSVRRISQELRPQMIDSLGIQDTIEWYLQNFAKRYEISYKFSSEINRKEINEHQAISMFRIFQEVLTNVARHSGASEIMVRLNSEGSDYLFEIKDNGKGISESEINSPKALGIIGMKERAFLLHGKLSIVGERAIGTTVLLRFPRKLKNAEKTYLQ